MTRNAWRIPASFLAAAAVLLAGFLWSRLPGAGFMATFGCALAAWFALYGCCRWLTAPAWRKAARIALLAALNAVVLLFAVTGTLIATHAQGGDTAETRVAVVFGAGVEGDRPSASLASRLESALAWWQEDRQRVLVLTGGKGDDENLAEARVMANWLLERGVPQEALHLEDQATDTRENVALSAPILDRLLQPGEPVAAISNEFHLYRCRFILASHGYEAVGVPAATPYTYLRITYSVRECCAIVVDWLGL